MNLRRLSGPAVVVLLWWLCTGLGWIAPDTLPSPRAVIDVGIDLARSGVLGHAILASSRRVLVGTCLGVVLGMSIAVLAGWSRLAEALLDSTMQMVKAIPAVALSPLFIVWVGIDEAPKVLLIAISTALPIYINVYGSIRNLDVHLVDTGRTLGLSQRELVRHIVVPSTVPAFLVGLRVSLANAWIALVVAEQINAHEGLGKLMLDARSWLRLDIMTLVIVLYAILGLLSYSLVRLLERRLLVWRRGFEGA